MMYKKEIKTKILLTIVIGLTIVLSGCIYGNLPLVDETSIPMVIPTVTPEPEPELSSTPVPTIVPTIAPTPINDTDKSNWSVCDPRHNASWLQKYDCYSSGGGSTSSNSCPPCDSCCPPCPIPEMITICMTVYGIFFIVLLYGRKGGKNV